MNPKTPTQLLSENSAENPSLQPNNGPAEPMAKKADARKNNQFNFGDKFNLLTIIGKSVSKSKKNILLDVKCDCGKITSVRWGHLKDGSTKSCGCQRYIRLYPQGFRNAKNTKHGHFIGNKTSKIRQAYNSMIGRCYRPNNASYAHYSRHGIKVCDRWLNGDKPLNGFECFEFDMGSPPSSMHSLDRKNNLMGYSPENCRWATPKEQANNRSTTKFLTLNGESKPLVEWSEFLGWPQSVLWSRIQCGWEESRILTVTPRKRNS